MLKPKREILRKEIKKDPFLEGVFSAKTHFETNKQRYYKIVASVAVIFLIATIFIRSQNTNREVAESILSKGMHYVEKGDHQNAMIYFQEAVDEYGSTHAGHIAGYYIGRIHYDRGDYNLAQPHLESYVSEGNNILLIGAACQALVNVHMTNGNIKEAISYQKRAIDNAASKIESAFASVKLAELYINEGNLSDSELQLNSLLKDHQDHFELQQKVNELYGQIESMK